MSGRVDARITVERRGDRLIITIERHRSRTLSLGLDEAALLAELVRREMPYTAIRRAESLGSAR